MKNSRKEEIKKQVENYLAEENMTADWNYRLRGERTPLIVCDGEAAVLGADVVAMATGMTYREAENFLSYEA